MARGRKKRGSCTRRHNETAKTPLSEVRALSGIPVGLVRTSPGCPLTAGASAASMPVHIGVCYEQTLQPIPGAAGQWQGPWLNQETSVEAGVRLGAVGMQQMASQGSNAVIRPTAGRDEAASVWGPSWSSRAL